MNRQYTYLLVDSLCLLFPLLLSFHPRIRFYKQWRYFALPCLLSALIFVLWDIQFTSMGVWNFNHDYVVGVFAGGLPLEEYLFFFCIPYCCVFTYYCISHILHFRAHSSAAFIFSFLLVGFLVVAGFSHLAQLYTSVTFLALSVLLLYLILARKVPYLLSFYTAFLIILVPFFMSNGILTGSLLDAPVVYYNSAYNLGIRLGTIPFEDVFYAMLLFLMNVAGFETLRKRGAGNIPAEKV